jgi:hypothetical protein
MWLGHTGGARHQAPAETYSHATRPRREYARQESTATLIYPRVGLWKLRLNLEEVRPSSGFART